MRMMSFGAAIPAAKGARCVPRLRAQPRDLLINSRQGLLEEAAMSRRCGAGEVAFRTRTRQLERTAPFQIATLLRRQRRLPHALTRRFFLLRLDGFGFPSPGHAGVRCSYRMR